MFKVDFSFKGLLAQLNRISKQYLPNAKRNLERAALVFIGEIQAKQMSGRRGSRYTNVITNTLRRDWFPRVTGSDKDLRVEVYSTTPYAKFQEYGTRNMNRRLYIREAWKRNGIKSMRESAKEAFKKQGSK
jgi:HK97 gp10 family phage protein